MKNLSSWVCLVTMETIYNGTRFFPGGLRETTGADPERHPVGCRFEPKHSLNQKLL